jgi:hypothetical protein
MQSGHVRGTNVKPFRFPALFDGLSTPLNAPLPRLVLRTIPAWPSFCGKRADEGTQSKPKPKTSVAMTEPSLGRDKEGDVVNQWILAAFVVGLVRAFCLPDSSLCSEFYANPNTTIGKGDRNQRAR